VPASDFAWEISVGLRIEVEDKPLAPLSWITLKRLMVGTMLSGCVSSSTYYASGARKVPHRDPRDVDGDGAG
jgi:hypothetical protein